MITRSEIVYGLAFLAAAGLGLFFVWPSQLETKPELASVEPPAAAPPAAPSLAPMLAPASSPVAVAEAAAERSSRDSQRGMASRGEAASGEQPPGFRVREVSWPDPKAIDAPLLESLPAALQESIDRSRVPVLLPRTLAASAELFPGAHWYTASKMGSDPSVVLHGTSIAHRRVEAPVTTRAAGAPDPGLVIPSEGTLRLTWEQYGVFYFLDIICRDPASDPRCSDPEYARSLRDDLAFVGGHP